MIFGKKIPIPMFSSLAFLTTTSIFVLTLIIMGIGGYFITSHIHTLNLENVQRESRNIAKLAARTLSEPMWNLNKLGTNENLKALADNDIICGTRVLDEDGKIFTQTTFPDALSPNQIVISEPVFFDDPTDDRDVLKTIGTLEVCTSTASFHAQIASILQRLLTSFGILSIAILLASYLSLQILLAPLRRFKNAMGDFLVSMKPISDSTLLKANEVGDLVQSFNILAISLSESYRSLKRAKEEAEDAIKVKTDFFANMSHELRTPLNSVIGMTQLLQTQKMSEEQQEMFDSIKRSGDNLLKIVNDILDISKIEAGQVQLEHTAFDVNREIRHIIIALLPIAQQKNLTLTYEIPDMPSYVFGDTLRFTRIITNIISNAIRYTETGSIKAYVRSLKIRDTRINLTVEVEDTGIGIPADKVDTIFEKFSQADTSTTRKYGGTGLGLTITKELIELMGGHIFVTSEVGKGSIFSFTIPFEIAQESDIQTNATADQFLDGTPNQVRGIPAAQVRVLLAEDHAMNQLFIKKLCKNLGMTNYTLVENGREAVNELAINSYDLILMDCHMPEMNGYDATVAIRNLDDPLKRSIPIVAMTANAMPEDEQRCLACGMSGYISKPIDMNVFKKTLSPWINFSVSE